MMTGAMGLSKVPINEIYTPISKVKILTLDTKMNTKTIKKILELGFSRIPIAYSKKNKVIVGILLVKTLLAIKKDGSTIG
jgi:CBS domain containing-hemolysin-like protein